MSRAPSSSEVSTLATDNEPHVFRQGVASADPSSYLRNDLTNKGVIFSRGGPLATKSLHSALSAVSDEHNLVIITTANFEYRRMVLNWACIAKKLPLPEVLVLALDPSLAEFLFHHNISAFFAPALTTKAVQKHGEQSTTGTWNTPDYNALVHLKTLHIASVLRLGFHTLFVDTDIVLLQDIRPMLYSYLAKPLREAEDVIMQQNWPQNELNPGFSLWRHSKDNLRFLDLVLETERNLEAGNMSSGYGDTINDDQHCYNYILACGFPDGAKRTKWLWSENENLRSIGKAQVLSQGDMSNVRSFHVDCGAGNGLRLKYGLFNPLFFQTGDGEYQGMRQHAVMIHPNFMRGGISKIQHLQRLGAWCLD